MYVGMYVYIYIYIYYMIYTYIYIYDIYVNIHPQFPKYAIKSPSTNLKLAPTDFHFCLFYIKKRRFLSFLHIISLHCHGKRIIQSPFDHDYTDHHFTLW